jgi:hypothetical protein
MASYALFVQDLAIKWTTTTQKLRDSESLQGFSRMVLVVDVSAVVTVIEFSVQAGKAVQRLTRVEVF